MGKRIITQARGHGGPRYRVRRKAFSVRPFYPVNMEGEWEVVKLFSSAGHSAPIAKLKNKSGEIFHNIAVNLLYEGQKIMTDGMNKGDVAKIGSLKNGTMIFNIESKPKDGGKFIRSGGNFAIVTGKNGNIVSVTMPSKQIKQMDAECRATIGRAAGDGRLAKPILKAGKQFYIKKAKSKLWPRTSAIKVNAIDHPFGSGRGKRPKSKIIPRMASPGQTVGLLRPRRTGRRKK